MNCPGSSKNSDLIHSIRGRSHVDFPEPPQTVVAVVPNMGPVGKLGDAVLAEPVGVPDAAVAGCQKPLVVTPRKLPLCRADSHSAVQAVHSAVLVRGAGPVAQTSRGERAEGPFLVLRMGGRVMCSASHASPR